MSDLSSAIVLGIVEGLTEYLPVSSTGHLIIAGEYLGFTGERASTFEIFIQLGAILAVVVIYFKRFTDLFFFSGTVQGLKGWDGIAKIGAACLPAFVLGAVLHGYIKTYLFSPLSVGFALIIGGVLLILIERREARAVTTDVESLTLRQAVSIGLFQCLALWPGVSRAGATIAGGMLSGCSRSVAAEFSFLVAVPIMCAAVSYDLFKSAGALQFSDLSFFGVGFVVAFVTALFAIKWFIGIVNRITLVPFGVYRILFGILVLWWVRLSV